tara:strand:+ start:1221 stop:1931 length:711 start_codon:yes stop_codon:yes gene_type:complete
MINLNSLSRKLLLLQRNELLTKRQKWLRKKFGRFVFTNILINYFQDKYLEKNTENLFSKEIETFKNYLPNSPKNIMDIGCGLGVIDIYLNRIFKNSPNFFLLDKNRIDNKIKYGFSNNYESYNDLSETKNILIANQINLNQINLFDVEKDITIEEEINLVISLKSMGYHYPFELYLKLFNQCCSKNTLFIFDLSKTYFDQNKLKKYFEKIQIIYEEDSIHPLKRVLCKGFIGDSLC